MDKHSENHKEEIIKTLRKELVSSEIRFQNIINQNSIPTLIVSQNGIIRFANPTAEYLFHKSKEKLIGLNIGYPMVSENSYEIVIPTKNNPPSIAEMRILDTIWEEEKVFMVSLRDVTERRKMEQELRVNEERYKSLVELSPFGIFIHLEGKCVFTNTAGIKLLGGNEPEDIIGQSIMRFVHPDYKEIVIDRINGLNSEQRQLPPLEEKFITLNGTIIDVEVSGIKFDYIGKTAVQLVVTNITERKKSEETIHDLNIELKTNIEEKTKQLKIINQGIETFCFSVLHDTKSLIQNLENKKDSVIETENSFIEKIKNVAVKMTSMVENLQYLAKIAQVELDFHSINFNSLCKEIVEEINHENSSQNLELILQSDMSIYADPNLMRIVMTNLLDNAIKFTRHRQYAKIEVGMYAKEGKQIVFIKDNGSGFNLRNSNNPFKPIHPNDKLETIGMGLTIVRCIIDRHNGKVWTESEEGKGSTFYFSVE